VVGGRGAYVRAGVGEGHFRGSGAIVRGLRGERRGKVSWREVGDVETGGGGCRTLHG
jgi:hypothetical protein